MTDSEIIKHIQQGNYNLFGRLIDKHQNMVFRTCMGFIHNKEDAEDLTQEIFIKAYQSLSSFKGESEFSTWLYRIAVNASLNKVRKNTKNFLLQRIDTFLSANKNKAFNISVTDTNNPENLLISAEYKAWVNAALNSLPDNQKTAIVLSKYDELTQKEIAEIMNITEGAVEALIQRAKSNLRAKLSKANKKK